MWRCYSVCQGIRCVFASSSCSIRRARVAGSCTMVGWFSGVGGRETHRGGCHLLPRLSNGRRVLCLHLLRRAARRRALVALCIRCSPLSARFGHVGDSSAHTNSLYRVCNGASGHHSLRDPPDTPSGNIVSQLVFVRGNRTRAMRGTQCRVSAFLARAMVGIALSSSRLVNEDIRGSPAAGILLPSVHQLCNLTRVYQACDFAK